MAEMVTPPRIDAFFKMLTVLNERYPECWPLLYQQIDRWMHEEMAELLRTESETYDWKVRCNKEVWADDVSNFDPNYPFEHLFHLAVHGAYAIKWWEDNFVWRGNKIQLRLKPMSSFLDGDAPIAQNREQHAITAFRHQLASGALAVPNLTREQLAPGDTGLSKRAAKKARLALAGNPFQTANAAALGTLPPAVAPPPALKWKNTCGFEICGQYNNGKCLAANAIGSAGPHTCLKHDQRIHACQSCGQPGHPASNCTSPAPYVKPVGKGGKGDKGKGKGGKGKGKGKGKR